MTPALAAVAPPADPPAALFVAGIFVGALVFAGGLRAVAWWDARAARPVCLNCCVAPVDEIGQYCTRCAHRPGAGGQVEPRRSVSPRSTPRLPDPGRDRVRSTHGVVPPPDRRWEG